MSNTTTTSKTINIQAAKRQFLPADFVITDWNTLEPFFKNLKERQIDSLEDLQKWMRDLSELEAVVSEDACWRQIKMTLDTTNKTFEDNFTFFVTEIEPKIKPYSFELNKKLFSSAFVDQLDNEVYFPYLRSVKNAIDLYREANIPLQSELSVLAQKFGAINGLMTVEVEGKDYTLQQAARFLQSNERDIRRQVFEKIVARRLQDTDALDQLFDQLLQRRHQVALNAGFENYRDYKFKELGRFDYSVEDCFNFHEAVEKYIVPLQKILVQSKQKALGLEVLKPWDTDATPVGENPLQPFEDGDELIDKSVETLSELDDYFADCILTMRSMKRLDLDSRLGKAPGGYNCPLAETGVPFIFMNAAGTMSDLITMMHESGHAFHSFLAHDLPLAAFKEYPMEMAELASMSMELFTMDYWNHFFDDEKDLQKAKFEELERVVSVLPWIATIDAFQHWLYTHPGHSVAERTKAWMTILNRFGTGMVDWAGFETYREKFWQKQLHLFEVPFYYIEYGIAQLGAIGMWKQYREKPIQALDNYKKALSLGYTKTLPELYKTAGIRFDFSPEYVEELAGFMKLQIDELIC